MTKILRITLSTVLVLAACSFSAGAETIKCSECGMILDMNSQFTAKIIQRDTTHYFCDIGDFFSYLKRKRLHDVGVQVKDYASGEWIDAYKASYVRAEKKFKTPMGWGIAAFKDKSRAGESGTIMNFDAMAATFK